MEKENTFLASIGSLVMVASVILLQAIVFAHLWGWYITVLGAPPVSYAHALMILIMGRLITLRIPVEQEKREISQVVRAIGIWLFAWGLGFALSPFVIL